VVITKEAAASITNSKELLATARTATPLAVRWTHTNTSISTSITSTSRSSINYTILKVSKE
jgi:hypothetical protein